MKFLNRKEKKIKQLEEEIEYLNEVIDLHQYAFLGLSVRIQNLEKIFVAMGLTEYKQKKEDLLLN